MAQLVLDTISKAEVRVFPIDFSDTLLSGEIISSATFVHAPPSGDPIVPTYTISADGLTLNVVVGPLLLKGSHLIDVHAIGSIESEPEIRLQLQVDW